MRKETKDLQNTEQKPKRSFKARVVIFFLNLFLVLVACVGLYVLFVFLQMPSLDSILHETREPAIVFLDKNGREIRADGRIMGAAVSVDNLPPHVWQAIVAIEDKRFFEHGAISYRGTFRAVVLNMFHGRFAAGGSTITQQTAKNIFLSRDKKVSRKIQELILSWWLENRFTKNQILDLYMNRISLVGGLRGVDAAATNLFGHGARELTLAESAQIAAMLKAPTLYSPLKNPERNIMRAKVILKEMERQGYITENEAQNAVQNLRAAPENPDKNIYRYWTDFVRDEIESRIGSIDKDLYVYTTIDATLQKRVAASLRAGVIEYEGAVVAIARDGAIVSMVGGDDYQTSQFNRVTALRQPGSAFKPVVYLVALENGMKPDAYVNDSPFSIGDYNPKNYDERYYGGITLATAFAKSVNSVPLKLTKEYGIDAVLNMAARLGVGSNLKREYSTVLGASEMSLLDLTTIYSVIWNEGNSVHPYSITKITDAHGNFIYARNPSEEITILQPQTVEYMKDLLHEVVTHGTGKRANADGVLGGKTGTSNDNRDAWFIGATPDYVIGVWVGRDDNTPMSSKVTGGTLPASIFHEIVK
ncbi:MAG: PBP1A family penicillin-binding protein [Alphaproteobacteria bacterium]|nr:PBP1A family penicillin-binding protein [Alphaproteobacteria bacterium]